jgi:hypothetical protein
MSKNYEKKGPELFRISEAHLVGIETLAKQAKQQRDEATYDFLMEIKTALSKSMSIVSTMHELADRLEQSSKDDMELAHLIRQLFPK